MKATVAILTVVAIVACSSKPPPAADPLKVSQQNMNLSMLERVKHEAQTLCSQEGGLKAIKWAYDTTPSGSMAVEDPYGPALDVSWDRLAKNSFERRLSKNEYETGRLMRIAATDPERFSVKASAFNGAMSAQYLCTTGVVLRSEAFEFLP